MAICIKLAEGQFLKDICKDQAMPAERTVQGWLAVNPTFKLAYARAREAQVEHWSEEIVTIADDATNDYVERIAKDGTVERVHDPEVVQRSKLRIATRQWLMSKLSPARYGDRVDLNVSASLQVETMSDAELEKRTRARLEALGVEVASPLLLGLPAPAPTDPAAVHDDQGESEA